MSSTHAFEMRFTKQRISFRKVEKFIEFLHEYAPVLHYQTREYFEYRFCSDFSLKHISRFLKYN